MKRAKATFRFRPQHILLFCALGCVLLASIFVSQRNKLAEIQTEQHTLTTQYDELLLQEEYLSRMVEYANTDEYLAQQIRETLGYVEPDDIKFYRNDTAQ